jgi:P27 family predicted phage terminase small subunit
MRGRKPKPNELKQLEGNPGKRPIPVDCANAPAAIPNCPPHIRGEARKEWRRVSVELVRLGLVARVDKAALALYCQLWERWILAEDSVRALGLVTTAAAIRKHLRELGQIEMVATKPAAEMLFAGMEREDRDFPGKNPYLSIAEACMDRMQKILVEFGMTPSSRARVKSTPAETPDEVEQFLFGSEKAMSKLKLAIQEPADGVQ